MPYISFIKSLPEKLLQPHTIAAVASVGIHGIIALSLPTLSAASKPQNQNLPANVKVVQLTPQELARVPLASLPPVANQTEPLPPVPAPPSLSYPPPPSYPSVVPPTDSNLSTIPLQPRTQLKTPPPSLYSSALPPTDSSSSTIPLLQPRTKFKSPKTATRQRNERQENKTPTSDKLQVPQTPFRQRRPRATQQEPLALRPRFSGNSSQLKADRYLPQLEPRTNFKPRPEPRAFRPRPDEPRTNFRPRPEPRTNFNRPRPEPRTNLNRPRPEPQTIFEPAPLKPSVTFEPTPEPKTTFEPTPEQSVTFEPTPEPSATFEPTPEPKATAEPQSSVPPAVQPEQKRQQGQQYAYNPSGTSGRVASVTYGSWLEKVKKDYPNLRIKAPIEKPIDYPTSMRSCLSPEPKAVGFVVVVDREGKTIDSSGPIGSTGYSKLDQKVLNAVPAAVQEALKERGDADKDKYVQYQFRFKFNQESCSAMNPVGSLGNDRALAALLVRKTL